MDTLKTSPMQKVNFDSHGPPGPPAPVTAFSRLRVLLRLSPDTPNLRIVEAACAEIERLRNPAAVELIGDRETNATGFRGG